MRIGFDVSPLHRPHPPGVVRAARGLVLALERRARVGVVRLAPPPSARIARWRQLDLPRFARTLDLAGIHSPVSAFALLGGGARVQTIHEIPWASGASENADARHRLWASVGPLRAHAVVCPSESTAALVRAASPPAAHKVHVCGWGVDPIFAAAPRADDDEVLARVGVGREPFVLAPGAVREKKNLAAVLRGLERAACACTLVVTGPLTPYLLGELARHPRVVARLPGEVDDPTLSALMRRAAAVAVLSTSEGFGLPVVEAQASGTPVIVRAASTQAEIAGDAALAVDDDASAFARALERAIDERALLSAAGLQNASTRTWDRCAESVERLWETLA